MLVDEFRTGLCVRLTVLVDEFRTGLYMCETYYAG